MSKLEEQNTHEVELPLLNTTLNYGRGKEGKQERQTLSLLSIERFQVFRRSSGLSGIPGFQDLL
jgi:hypothetical protein